MNQLKAAAKIFNADIVVVLLLDGPSETKQCANQLRYG